jgi:hypothetical protein
MSKWLKCKVVKGMFSDELTVVVRTLGGEDVAVFVPRDQVQEGSGRVKVRVSEASGHTMAVLPDANQSVIDVNASQLTPA